MSFLQQRNLQRCVRTLRNFKNFLSQKSFNEEIIHFETIELNIKFIMKS